MIDVDDAVHEQGLTHRDVDELLAAKEQFTIGRGRIDRENRAKPLRGELHSAVMVAIDKGLDFDQVAAMMDIDKVELLRCFSPTAPHRGEEARLACEPLIREGQLTWAEIARRTGVRETTVSYMAKRLGISAPKSAMRSNGAIVANEPTVMAAALKRYDEHGGKVADIVQWVHLNVQGGETLKDMALYQAISRRKRRANA